MASMSDPAVVPVSSRPTTLAAAVSRANWVAVKARLHSADR